jgi:hypothetical protein
MFCEEVEAKEEERSSGGLRNYLRDDVTAKEGSWGQSSRLHSCYSLAGGSMLSMTIKKPIDLNVGVDIWYDT